MIRAPLIAALLAGPSVALAQARQPNDAPPVPSDHYADRVFDPAVMAKAREQLRAEHGGGTYWQVMASVAEYRAGEGPDGYAWRGEAWRGGDINRLVVKSEGEGASSEGVEAAEVQALYSRAVTPTFDLQLGLRQDLGRGPDRTYAAVGFEGTAPYWFELEGAAFVSNRGDVSARLEASYDLRLTQRLILQPRTELTLAAQSDAKTQVGSGLSQAELGLRLRYALTRTIAPYVGVAYERRYGRTADYARAAGEDAEVARLVFGLRAFF